MSSILFILLLIIILFVISFILLFVYKKRSGKFLLLLWGTTFLLTGLIAIIEISSNENNILTILKSQIDSQEAYEIAFKKSISYFLLILGVIFDILGFIFLIKNNKYNKLSQLEKLGKLKDQGLITDEEFNKQKLELLK